MSGLGFIEAMAFAPPGDSEFVELAAGLFVLQVVMETRSHAPAGYATMASAYRQVALVENIPIHGHLKNILHHLDEPALMSRHLLAYARELQERGHLAPAIEVCELLGQRDGQNPEVRLEAMYRHAWMLRLLKRFQLAEAKYADLEVAAAEAGSMRYLLESRLGMGKLTMNRGNTPGAAVIIANVIREAEAADERVVLAKARVDMAVIEGVRYNPRGVVEYAVPALDDLAAEGSYYHALHNIGVALRELGAHDTAHKALAAVFNRAKPGQARSDAAIMLYHLAIDRRDFENADDWRRRMHDYELTPEHRASIQEAIGRDEAERGHWAAASLAYDRMLVIATQHQMSELIFRAERGLNDIFAQRAPTLYAYRPSEQRSNQLRNLEQAVVAHCANGWAAPLDDGYPPSPLRPFAYGQTRRPSELM